MVVQYALTVSMSFTYNTFLNYSMHTKEWECLIYNLPLNSFSFSISLFYIQFKCLKWYRFHFYQIKLSPISVEGLFQERKSQENGNQHIKSQIPLSMNSNAKDVKCNDFKVNSLFEEKRRA